MKIIIIFLLVLLVNGCVSEPPKSTELSNSNASTTNEEKIDGYSKIVDKVWITDKFESITDSVNIFSTKPEKDIFYNNYLEYIESKGITPNLSERVVNRMTERVIAFDDTELTIVYNDESGSIAVRYYTPNGDNADTIFSVFKFLNGESIIDNTRGKPIDSRSLDSVKAFMEHFGMLYEYEYIANGISTELFQEIQSKGKEYFEPGDFPDIIYEIDPFEFDVITLIPVLEDILLIDEVTSFGNINQINVTNGPILNFVLYEGEIIYGYVAGMYAPSNKEESIKVEKERILSAIKERYNDVQLTDNVYIEAIKFRYAPIADQNASEAYKNYELQPLLEIIYRQGDLSERFFISPLTYTEVR